MNKIVLRIIVGIVWLIAGVMGAVNGNYFTCAGFSLLGVVFILSALKGRKNKE